MQKKPQEFIMPYWNVKVNGDPPGVPLLPYLVRILNRINGLYTEFSYLVRPIKNKVKAAFR